MAQQCKFSASSISRDLECLVRNCQELQNFRINLEDCHNIWVFLSYKVSRASFFTAEAKNSGYGFRIKEINYAMVLSWKFGNPYHNCTC